MSKAYRDLVEAVQSLCLASADDGTGPDDERLHGVLKPLTRALVLETLHTNPCERRHADRSWNT